ncbi:MAG: gfo/Idh/MocA family oxidoreductase, partial [Betaproteobacteria bacterium]|nr:gfo/Idh/MocA family oxidoreductase [Betaproteobacteria bacterium]
MSKKRIKVAVVGAGFSNSPDGRERWAVRTHVPALKALPDIYDLAAVCTTRMETATTAAKHFDVPHAFDSVERMLKEMPDLEAICVSVRPTLHHQVVMAALRAGKHVYCEQPLGLNTQEAQEMYELARRNNLRTVLGHQSHYEPATLQMAELVRAGFIGEPLAFNHAYFVSNQIVPRPSHRQWVFDGKSGGHPGFRSGHSLDRINQVIGRDVTEICADMAIQVPVRANVDGGEPIRSTQVDNTNYLLRVGDTVMGTMQTCFTAWFGTGSRFELYGSDGMLMLDTVELSNWDKKTGQGDPPRGELRLFGAHADLAQMMKDPIAPERLERRFTEIPLDDKHITVKGIDRGRATFLVAQTWTAFHKAIGEGRDGAPSFRDE